MKKIFKSFFTKYKNLKLKQKFLLLLLLCIIPVIIVSGLIYINITNSLIKSQLELAMQDFKQVESFLNYRLERIYQTTYMISLDPDLNNILNKDTSTYSLNQQIKDITAIKTYLNQFQSDNTKDSLKLYVPDEFSYSSEEKLIFSIENAKDKLWYKNTFNGWGWITCNPPEFVEGHNSVAIVRPIRDLEHYKHLIGAVRIDISLDEIEQMLEAINASQGGLSYIVTDEDLLVGASSHKLFKKLKLNNEDLNNSLSSETDFIKLNILDEKVWTYANYLNYKDLILVTVLPENGLANGIKLIQMYFILALSVLVIIITIIIVPSINSITKRLKLLVKKMKMVQEGDLNANLHSNCHDEIGLLVYDFNFMLEEINKLMQEQYKLGQELKSAELKALQSQINPHFLYNALEMIGWMAYKKEPKEIQATVNTLAQFFRLSLNHGNDITSIADEIKLIESYLHIQCSRFQNNLNINVDIQEDIFECAIPKITLQPIVENSIIHGILEKDSRSGTIKVSGELKENNMIELSIEDDGKGMTNSEIKQLMQTQNEPDNIDSYGLKNIEMRICLFFNIKKAIRIISQPGVGTRVTITIPAVRL